jgi:thioredoxin 1
MASPYVNELDNDTFADAIKADVPVLVDFWAPWCGPCKALSPTIDQIADEVGGDAKICKVNIDEAMEVAARFGIQNIPTILIFKGGEVVQKFVGVQQKATLLSALK